jgi:hypothetical protein
LLTDQKNENSIDSHNVKSISENTLPENPYDYSLAGIMVFATLLWDGYKQVYNNSLKPTVTRVTPFAEWQIPPHATAA